MSFHRSCSALRERKKFTMGMLVPSFSLSFEMGVRMLAMVAIGLVATFYCMQKLDSRCDSVKVEDAMEFRGIMVDIERRSLWF